MKHTIGSETWDCDGHPLTPAMRREILLKVIELYESWKALRYSHELDMEEGELVVVDQHDVATVGEFLRELTGEEATFDGEYPSYYDDLVEWLLGYVLEHWGEDIYEEADDDTAPTCEAELRVTEWLDGALIADLVAWRDAMVQAESRSADWPANGF